MTRSRGLLGVACALSCACASRQAPVSATSSPPEGEARLTLEGRLHEGLGARPTLTIYELTSGGLRPAAVGEVIAVDASAAWSVTLVKESPEPLLIVTCEDGDAMTAALVSTRADVDGRVIVPFLDGESTVETAIYLRARLLGLWRPELAISRLRALVTPELVRGIATASDSNQAIEVTARAVASSLDAWQAMMRRQNDTVDQSDLLAISAGFDMLQLLIDMDEHARPMTDAPRRARVLDLEFPGAVADLFEAHGVGAAEVAAAAMSTAETLSIVAGAAPFPLNEQLRRVAETTRLYYTAPFLLEQALAFGLPPLQTRLLVTALAEVHQRLLSFDPLSGPETWIEEAWMPLLITTEEVLAAAAPTVGDLERQKASVDAALGEVEYVLTGLSAEPSPELLSRTVVETLLPVVPRREQLGVAEEVFQTLVVVEMPSRANGGQYSMVRWQSPQLLP